MGLSCKQDVTVVLTSCGRYDLLDRTLESFRTYNTDPGVKEVIVVEDGIGDPSDLCRRHGATLIRIGAQAGQIKAIDAAYAQVTTPYIFHLEDDWEFYHPGFIERSRKVLETDPSTVCVWLRAWDDTNGHPLSFRSSREEFGVVASGFLGCWHGFSFNPGLRRQSDYKLVGPFADLVRSRDYEAEIGQKYFELGYRAVVLRESGYVRHIGGGRSTLGNP
jgi:glycosyltransferase involved in cell wall biosynthesis